MSEPESEALGDHYEALVRRFAAGINLSPDLVRDIGRCTPRSEAHRRWAAWWAGYAATTLVVGVVADTAAQVGWGYPATLTCGIRRWLGVEPQTRYARAGQAVIVGALGWGALHLSLGILGPTRGKETP